MSEKTKYIEDNHDTLWRQVTEVNAYTLVCKETKFLASKMMTIPFSFSDVEEHATACTDGKQIMFDPMFWESLSLKERAFVMCHELFHIILMHPDRGYKLKPNPQIWNIAIDAVVNSILVKGKVGEMPKDGIKPNWCGDVELNLNGKILIIKEAHKKTAETVYWEIIKHLEDNPGNGGQGQGQGQGQGEDNQPQDGDGDQENQTGQGDGKGGNQYDIKQNGKEIKPIDHHMQSELTPKEVNEIKRSIRRMLVEAKMRGNMPSFMQEMLAEEVKPKINWKAWIKSSLSPSFRVYNSFVRPHRRSQAMGFTMPGPVKKGVKATLAIDTSGSIGRAELSQFISEMKSIFKTFPTGATEITLLLHTTDVYSEKKLKTIQDTKNIDYASGGTSHIEVFERAEKNGAKILICLTDGETDWPNKCGIENVIVVSTLKSSMNNIPRYAKKIYLDIKELGGR
jgi:predicted metal-dependent peptidase